ncbi:MAG: hypothetical protein IZT59_07300 [Verrucomicrobia bacterium]|nr:hypothetical protein [Verrucomicrobiota bacterium]
MKKPPPRHRALPIPSQLSRFDVKHMLVLPGWEERLPIVLIEYHGKLVHA